MEQATEGSRAGSPCKFRQGYINVGPRGTVLEWMVQFASTADYLWKHAEIDVISQVRKLNLWAQEKRKRQPEAPRMSTTRCFADRRFAIRSVPNHLLMRGCHRSISEGQGPGFANDCGPMCFVRLSIDDCRAGPAVQRPMST